MRCSPFQLLIVCACAILKANVKTGPAKTGPAGPLATAMYALHVPSLGFVSCTFIYLEQGDMQDVD